MPVQTQPLMTDDIVEHYQMNKKKSNFDQYPDTLFLTIKPFESIRLWDDFY